MTDKKTKPRQGARRRAAVKYRKLGKIDAKLAPAGKSGRGGGEPPMSHLEARVGHLERDVGDIRATVARIEAKIDTFATKTEMAQLETRVIKWYVGTSFTMVGLVAAITFAAARILAS